MQHYPLSYQVDTVVWDGSFVRRLPAERYTGRLAALREAGVGEVMISGYVTVEEADFDLEEGAKELGQLLAGYGMHPAQHHGLSALYTALDRPQDPVIERLIRSLRYTAAMNAPVLVLHPCHYYDPECWNHLTVEQYFLREAARHGEQRIMDTAVENLRAVCGEAKRLGVKIALENLDRFEPMGDPQSLVYLVERVNDPMVGYCLDAGHAHCCGRRSVVDWIGVMGKKLFTTHFHDNRGPHPDTPEQQRWIAANAKLDEHLPVGFGTIPWLDVVRALRQTGYANTVNFECGPWPGGQDYRGAVAYWRSVETLAEER